MPKEKAPKPIVRYDPTTDRLNHLVHLPDRPTMSDAVSLLKHASEANEKSGAVAWDLDSDFQKKIERITGPLPHYKEADHVEFPIGEGEVL